MAATMLIPLDGVGRTHFGLLALVTTLQFARPALAEPQGAKGEQVAAPSPSPSPMPGSPLRGGPAATRPEGSEPEGAKEPAPVAPANVTDVSMVPPPVAAPDDSAPTAGPPAAAAAPSSAPASAGVGGVGTAPTEALVHLAVNYGRARLEARSLVDVGEWRVLCDAPCDRTVHVEGEEMRVTAPGMTSSNPFLVAPGPGAARFRVSGGSATARTVGIIGLSGGLPITFAGVSIFGVGSVNENSAERAAGIATMVVGAVITLASLPCLLAGSTSVRNEHGKYIARGAAQVPLL